MKKLEGDFLGRFLSKDDTSPFDESSRGEETTYNIRKNKTIAKTLVMQDSYRFVSL